MDSRTGRMISSGEYEKLSELEKPYYINLDNAAKQMLNEYDEMQHKR